MSEMPFALSQRVAQRQVALSGGATLAPMMTGPKWVCQLVGTAPTPNPVQLAAAREWLRQLRPLNVALDDENTDECSLLACAARDGAGRVSAYAAVTHDGIVEIVGVLPSGMWSHEPCTWWPGSYELPLIRQLDTVYQPLREALQGNATAYLCMSLLAVQHTALIAKGELGSERPYRLPAETATLTLPPVRLGTDAAAGRAALLAALDLVRECAGVTPPHPFYL